MWERIGGDHPVELVGALGAAMIRALLHWMAIELSDKGYQPRTGKSTPSRSVKLVRITRSGA